LSVKAIYRQLTSGFLVFELPTTASGIGSSAAEAEAPGVYASGVRPELLENFERPAG